MRAKTSKTKTIKRAPKAVAPGTDSHKPTAAERAILKRREKLEVTRISGEAKVLAQAKALMKKAKAEIPADLDYEAARRYLLVAAKKAGKYRPEPIKWIRGEEGELPGFPDDVR